MVRRCGFLQTLPFMWAIMSKFRSRVTSAGTTPELRETCVHTLTLAVYPAAYTLKKGRRSTLVWHGRLLAPSPLFRQHWQLMPMGSLYSIVFTPKVKSLE